MRPPPAVLTLAVAAAAALPILPFPPAAAARPSPGAGSPGEFPSGGLAAPAAVVVSGDARFTVLTDRLLRLEWAIGGAFEDRASLVFVNRKLPVPPFTVDTSGETLTIDTGPLLLSYRKGSGRFTPDNLTVSLAVDGRTVTWRPGTVDSLNLKGTTRTLDGTNGARDVELEDGILSKTGWALVDDSRGNLFDGGDPDWVTPRPAGERQDWYFFGHGHDYRAALGDFTLTAGRIPLPPRFAFGYWWSRYWTYSDAELRDLVGRMDSYGVPLDVLIVDMDWHETFGLSSKDPRRDPFGQEIGWTGYTWNRRLFPSPERFLSFVHGEGLRTALNLHPASGIPPMEERYGEFARAYGFDTTGSPYIPFAVEDRKWVTTWFDVVLRPLERQGVDFWWLDWQAWLENTKVAGLSNTWWLNHVFFTEMQRRGSRRPILFHRWGGLGNHRYQIGFSGDSWSTWEALAYQPYFTATAGNVGYGYWSHDIGGHVGNDPDPELYLRWLQWGAFSPVLRTHSTKSTRIERRIWQYPGRFEAMREAIRLRYRLNPYIYTAAREAYDSGVSLCRPMYYDHPSSPEAYEFTGQYMFGADLLVAPVTAKADSSTGLAAVRVWLPEGEWYEWFSGTTLSGDTVITRSFTDREVPVWVRAGSVVPMYPQAERLGTVPDTVILSVIPGPGGGGRLYEDDGETDDYRDGQCAFTSFTKETTAPGSVAVTIDGRKGRFEGMKFSRPWVIEFPSTLAPFSVRVNGTVYEGAGSPAPRRWVYDPVKLGASIYTPPLDCGSKVVIEVRWTGGDGDGSALLSGMAGTISRLPRIVDIVKDEVNLRDQIANAPATVLAAGSIRTMIAYRPDRTAEVVRGFRDDLHRFVADVVGYPGGRASTLSPVVALLGAGNLVTDRPVIRLERSDSDRPVKVSMATSVPGAVVRYTLDGSLPSDTSSEYTGPFTLGRTAEVRARSFAPGLITGFASGAGFRLTFATSVAYAFPNSPKYDGGGTAALVDGRFGDPDDFRRGWVGFQGNDLVATVCLDSARDLSRVSVRCLQNQQNWIFLPVGLTVETSRDGKSWNVAGTLDTRAESLERRGMPEVREIVTAVRQAGVRFLRVTAKSPETLPGWHPSAGEKAWVFADEIVVE